MSAPAPKVMSYGRDKQQTITIYPPSALPVGRAARRRNRKGAMAFTHGGGWRRGDADAANVIKNKLPWLGSLDMALIAIEYRKGVDSDPRVEVEVQAEDLASAMGFIKSEGEDNGIDLDHLIMSGHSAGAHLTMLVNSDASLVRKAGGRYWKGVAAIDSAAYNVPYLMNHLPHDPSLRKLYTDAFLDDPEYWAEVSPYDQLHTKLPDTLLVYSGNRGPGDERDTTEFAKKAAGFQTKVTVLKEMMDHGPLNSDLGLPGEYTDSFTKWMKAALAA